jgi:hypothetical protein
MRPVKTCSCIKYLVVCYFCVIANCTDFSHALDGLRAKLSGRHGLFLSEFDRSFGGERGALNKIIPQLTRLAINNDELEGHLSNT